MLVTENLGIGVVVEKPEFVPPSHEHGQLGIEQQPDHGTQRLRPVLRPA